MSKKVHIGPNGGQYIMRYGKKKYLNKFSQPYITTNNKVYQKESLIPEEYRQDVLQCQDIKDPITLEYFVDPVKTSDGFTYERNSIQDWFERGNNTSPYTGARLNNRNLIPNTTLKNRMDILKSICMQYDDQTSGLRLIKSRHARDKWHKMLDRSAVMAQLRRWRQPDEFSPEELNRLSKTATILIALEATKRVQKSYEAERAWLIPSGKARQILANEKMIAPLDSPQVHAAQKEFDDIQIKIRQAREDFSDSFQEEKFWLQLAESKE